MYKAKESFTTKDYDVRRGQILAEDFTTQDEITEFLSIGYIEEYDGSLDITENGTYDVTGYDQAVVNVGGGGGGSDLDWTALGYTSRPKAIDTGYNYAKEIKQSWTSVSGSLANKYQYNYQLVFMPEVDTSEATSMASMFYGCYALMRVANLDTTSVTNMSNMFFTCYVLEEIPLFNTSNVTNFNTMLSGCSNLKEVPQFNLSKATNIKSMFSNCTKLVTVPQFNIPALTNANNIQNIFNNCPSLSNESLNNILGMCISATSFPDTGYKTLTWLGISSTNYPASTIQGLSNYQAFLDAGWTIGY